MLRNPRTIQKLEIERIFWELIEHKQEWNDTWISALDFVKGVSQRYINAGLLAPEFASEILPEAMHAHG